MTEPAPKLVCSLMPGERGVGKKVWVHGSESNIPPLRSWASSVQDVLALNDVMTGFSTLKFFS